MKKTSTPPHFYLTLFAFLLISNMSFSQGLNEECGTRDIDFGYVASVNPPNFDNYEPKLYNVFFWPVYLETSTSTYSLDEEEALTAIANLNREFNRFRIYFKYGGMQPLYSDDFEEFSTGDGNCPPNDETAFGSFINIPGNQNSDTFNVYLFKDICGAGGIFFGNRQIYMRENLITNWHFPHEMGHAFQLGHTHFDYEHYEIDDDGVLILDKNDNPIPNDSCERVTRDEENNPLFNARINGDGIVSTAAMPIFNRNHHGQNNATNDVIYEYTGDGTDCSRVDDYQISSIDLKNFMNNGTESPKVSLLEDGVGFTNEQGFRMRGAIESGPYAQALDDADNDGDFSPLYEPYKGSYYVAGPAQNPNDAPHFQPGFDYEFVSCNCDCNSCPIHPECVNEPSDYTTTNFQTNSNIVLSIDKYHSNYDDIVQPNHTAIRILNLPTNSPITAPITRRCYDNNNRAAGGGKVTKFNDDIFNTNTTVTPKDSTQINSPLLINGLPAGLYVIDKTFEDGSTEQQVIQKGNN
jgi:hypothetical protein